MRRSFALFLLVSLLIGVCAADQINILNNGGFEYGLMCYGNWIWSYTGQDYKGDYQFLMSTDAHSGSYSVEIRCTGADCMKAAIISNNIPSPPGQSYDLSMYAKCPAGRSAIIYVPGTTSGDIVQALTCDGSWALNRVSFQLPPTVTEFHFAVYNRDIEWLRVDDIVLTYVGGDAPLQPVLYPGVRNVTLSDKAVMVDGAPYLALGFFSVGYDDLQLAASQGANTVSALLMSPGTDCYSTRQKELLGSRLRVGTRLCAGLVDHGQTRYARDISRDHAAFCAAPGQHRLVLGRRARPVGCRVVLHPRFDVDRRVHIGENGHFAADRVQLPARRLVEHVGGRAVCVGCRFLDGGTLRPGLRRRGSRHRHVQLAATAADLACPRRYRREFARAKGVLGDYQRRHGHNLLPLGTHSRAAPRSWLPPGKPSVSSMGSRALSSASTSIAS